MTGVNGAATYPNIDHVEVFLCLKVDELHSEKRAQILELTETDLGKDKD